MNELIPDAVPWWFRAVATPKRDATPYKYVGPATANASTSTVGSGAAGSTPNELPAVAKAQQWKPFSAKECSEIEAAYNKLLYWEQTNAPFNEDGDAFWKVLCCDDNLFEVDVRTKEIYPVYWEGPTFEIRRSTWFSLTGTGGAYQPCDDNLTRQLEDGYRKFTPWVLRNIPPSSTAASSATSHPTINVTAPNSPSSSIDDLKTPKKLNGDQKSQQSVSHVASPQQPEARWALFGPYMNQYVVYVSSTAAWLQSDGFSQVLTRAVMSSSGIKLIRGWNEVQISISKLKGASPSRPSTSKLDEPTDKLPPAPNSLLTEPSSSSHTSPSRDNNTPTTTAPIKGDPNITEEPDRDRPIDHLVFVIHGIGQKLSERIDAINFPQDCDVLRAALNNASKMIKESSVLNKTTEGLKIPRGGGIQVLPIQWRHTISFSVQEKELADRDKGLTLEQISLENIPSIRMLVTDVILDVLLYMTPKYREEMIRSVTSELNRVYRLYKKRNPAFKGQVSIYGHSLGSVLAFDILSHQHDVVSNSPKKPKGRQTEVDISDLLAGPIQEGKISGLMEQKDNMSYPKLDFKVNFLLAFGSPIGMFLLLRGNKLKAYDENVLENDASVIRLDVNEFFNIFHPYDPVAHRIEPLVFKEFYKTKPMPIEYTKGGLTKTIAGIQDLGSGIVEKSKNFFFSIGSGLASGISTTAEMVNQAGRVINMVGFSSAANAANNTKTAPTSPQQQSIEMDTIQQPSGSASESSKSKQEYDEQEQKAQAEMHKLNSNGRIDFVMQEGVLENPYLSSLGVHMNYWNDSDCSVFLLKQFYDIPVSTNTRRTSTYSENNICQQSSATNTIPNV